MLKSQNVTNILRELRFAELNDEVIEKIRKAAFHHPLGHKTQQISTENIAELIRRKGVLDAVAAKYTRQGGEDPIFTILFKENRLTDEVVEYALLERPNFLEDLGPGSISRIPENILTAIVFGDKSSELSESTFKTALKTILEIQNRYSRKQISLSIKQIEALVRNPHIISREEFDRATEEGSRMRFYEDDF